MQTLWRDLRYGFRILLKRPGFAAVAVLTLALGVGVNTAIFSIVDAVLLRPLPYPQSDRLVMLWSTMRGQGIPTSGSALPDYREWRDRCRSFEGLAGFYYSDFNLAGGGAEPERVQRDLHGRRGHARGHGVLRQPAGGRVVDAHLVRARRLDGQPQQLLRLPRRPPQRGRPHRAGAGRGERHRRPVAAGGEGGAGVRGPPRAAARAVSRR